MVKCKKDLTGNRYERLVVIQQADDYISPKGKAKSQWLCRCDCGKEIVALGTNLQKGNTRSCGCYHADMRIRANTTHGGRHTRLYGIWINMRDRCHNENNHTYINYGARGIDICEEWDNSFECFREWAMSHGYNDELSIDRIDNNRGYSPDNCQWTDAIHQARNRRSSRYVEVDGVRMTLAEWADVLGYSRSIFHARAKLYHTTVEEQVAILAHEYYSKLA